MFASDAGDVSPLHIAVDGHNQTFALACVGTCEAGERLISRIDSRGHVVFSKRLTSGQIVDRLDLLALSKDGRVGLAGDRVAPDGTTQFTVAVFRRDGRLEWQAHDHIPAHALDAKFDARGEFVVVGAASDGSGLAVAFGPREHRHVGWRFTAPQASFSRVRTDAHGAISLAGTVGAANGGAQAEIWRLHARGGHLAWTYASPFVTFVNTPVALAVDDDGNSALVSIRTGPTTVEGETVIRWETTSLDAQGGVSWTAEESAGVYPPGLLDAAFSSCGDLTEFGRRQGSARIGGGFKTVRYDTSGNALWGHDDDEFGFVNTRPAAMAIGADNSVAEVGAVLAKLDQNPPTGWIAVYGNDGSLLSGRPATDVPVDVARDSADGIITIGHLDASTVVSRETESGTP